MDKVHSVIVGEGKPLIFLPASGFTGIEGLTIAEALSDSFESHLLDMPGGGRSSGISGKVTAKKIADWLKEYIDEHQFKKVSLIGHSMGAGLALCFAANYPENVDHLILIDFGHRRMSRFPVKELGPLGIVFPIIGPFEKWLVNQVKKRMFIDEPLELTKEQKEADIQRFCRQFHVEPTPQVRKALSETVDFTEEGFRLMLGVARTNFPKLLMQLKVPTLLIYATFDSINEKIAKKTKKQVQRLEKGNSFLKTCGIDGHHYLHWERPETIQEIKEFLRK